MENVLQDHNYTKMPDISKLQEKNEKMSKIFSKPTFKCDAENHIGKKYDDVGYETETASECEDEPSVRKTSVFCAICLKKVRWDTLEGHIFAQHVPGWFSSVCPLCGEVSKNFRQCVQHVMFCHCIKHLQTLKPVMHSYKQTSTSLPPVNKCGLCDLKIKESRWHRHYVEEHIGRKYDAGGSETETASEFENESPALDASGVSSSSITERKVPVKTFQQKDPMGKP